MFPSLGKRTARKNIKRQDYRVQKSLVHFNKLMQLPFQVYSPTVILTPTVQVVAPPETISVPVEPSSPKAKKKTISVPPIGPRNLKPGKKTLPKQQIDDLSDRLQKIYN